MTSDQIKERIIHLQEVFGMTNTRLADILEMPLNTFKQKKYNKDYRFFEDELNRLIHFINKEADKLPKN